MYGPDVVVFAWLITFVPKKKSNTMVENKANLPHEAADWITAPFARFLKIEAAAAGLLLLAVLVAMILANSAWAGFSGILGDPDWPDIRDVGLHPFLATLDQ